MLPDSDCANFIFECFLLCASTLREESSQYRIITKNAFITRIIGNATFIVFKLIKIAPLYLLFITTGCFHKNKYHTSYHFNTKIIHSVEGL